MASEEVYTPDWGDIFIYNSEKNNPDKWFKIDSAILFLVGVDLYSYTTYYYIKQEEGYFSH